ncbi:MAG: exo-alpha-sialidase [Candidatus Hydrogenedentes bacterium]|nr:exo-alpha-sialidase [Candidatus Hydrogenedentota bacterium]
MRHLSASALPLVLGSCLLLAQPASATLGFAEPAVLNSTAASDAAAADNTTDIATDGDGHWVAVWSSFNSLGNTIGTDSDILVARSNDNGATWTNAAPLNSNADVDAGSDSNPVVSTDGAGVWIAAWATTDDLEETIGTDGDILFARSTDNGVTWSDVSVLHSNADTDSGVDAMPRLVNDGGLNWIASWQSTDTLGGSVGTDNDVFYVLSDDGGLNWTGVTTLNSNASTDIGLDTNATIATDRAGNWVAVWETNDPFGNTVGTDYDIFVARSTNNGQSWTTMAPLNSNATTDTGNDRAPSVEYGGAGEWALIWHSNDTLGNTVGTDNDIFVASSEDSGATWSDVKALDPNAGTDTVGDVNATVRSDTAGNWLAVWHGLHTVAGGDYDVFASSSSDGGATWGLVAVLYEGADSDVGNDINARAATDGLGNWAVAWQSTNSLSGTIGSDNDILISTSSALSVNGLTVIAPNGDEKWKHDSKRKILWSSTGTIGAKVRLDLFRNGSFITTIKTKTKNDGKQSWILPSNIPAGTGYAIRVTAKQDANIMDESDGTFRIKPAN